jgi:hypothetical protein
MSDIDNYDSEYQTEDSDTRNPVRARMKQLEKETADLRKQVAESEVAKRELAFVKAGIDPASPMSKYFVKAYDGELSPEAIREAAVEAQLISPPDSKPSADEANAWSTNRKNRVQEPKQRNHLLTGTEGSTTHEVASRSRFNPGRSTNSTTKFVITSTQRKNNHGRRNPTLVTVRRPGSI